MRGSVVIVGGGVMGAATACFLARDHGVAVTVFERDPLYRRASSALSASSIRQQFSQGINSALSQGSLRFLQRVGDELAVGSERPHTGLVEPGYLYVVTEAGRGVLCENQVVQRAHGADVTLLTVPQLQQRFPWLHCDDLTLELESLRLRSAWAGYYEMNTFDHDGRAGALPDLSNVFTACGFSGHGMQQAPAVGSAMAALIANGASKRCEQAVLAGGASRRCEQAVLAGSASRQCEQAVRATLRGWMRCRRTG